VNAQKAQLPTTAPLVAQNCFYNPDSTTTPSRACTDFYDPAFTTTTATTLRGAYASPANADDGPAALATYLTSTSQFESCVAQNVASSFLGRPLTSDDADLQSQLAQTFQASGKYSMRALVRALVKSDAYRAGNNLSSAEWRRPVANEHAPLDARAAGSAARRLQQAAAGRLGAGDVDTRPRPAAARHLAQDQPRVLPAETYIRSYLHLFGRPLARGGAKGAARKRRQRPLRHVERLPRVDGHARLSGRHTPRSQTNTLMLATFERLGIALCDRALEHDWAVSAPRSSSG